MGSMSESITRLRSNDRQWRAFTTEGHCVVLAPPGSGKTEVLTTRMAWDLVHHIPEPRGVACVTLTVAAAEELRARIADLQSFHRPNVFIGTVHSFLLNEIILPFARVAGRADLSEITIVSESQGDALLRSVVYDVYGPSADISNIPSTVQINRRRLATDEIWARYDPRMKVIAERYVTAMQGQGLTDFTELVRIAVDMVEHSDLIRKALNAKFPRLYVDEYQDLEPGLDRLVRALCLDPDAGCQLFAVGDPDQAIYGFTGTMPELLRELSGHPDITTVNLQTNYRCGRQIIDMAQTFKESDSVVVGHREGGQADVRCCPEGFEQQCVRTAQWIGQVQEHYPLHEIGVICPTHEQCEQVTQTLRSAHMPVFYRRKEDYRPTRATLFIEACAAWCCFGMETSHYRLANLLRTWQYMLGQHWSEGADTALVPLLLEHTALTEPPGAEVFIESLTGIGMGRALQRPSMKLDHMETTKLITALRTGDLGAGKLTDIAERARLTDRVEVRTNVSCKGLEFDAVAILGLDEDRVPHFAAQRNPSEMREERRKFYVALTRARHQLLLAYSGFVEWKSGKTSYSGPSRFLEELHLVNDADCW